MKSFNNKLAYVTGGSSGIGLALADQLLKVGASVHLFARNKNRLDKAVNQLKENNAGIESNRIKISSLDVSDNAMVMDVMSQTMKASGVPDLVINCAGIAYPEYFENIPYEVFRKTMSVNLEGPWNVLSAVLPEMKKRNQGGHILTTSSVAGFVGTFGYTAYSASKFAVIGLSETLRGELKPYGISISILCPPDTDTPGFKEENKTKPPETVAISGNVKLMSPEKVAKTVIRGISKNKFMIIPGFMGKITYLLKSLFPSLLFKIMDGEAGKIHKMEN